MKIKNILRNWVIAAIAQPKSKVNIGRAQINYNRILTGQHIVITGGSKGIGFEMAKKMVSEGATVIITGRNEDALKKAVSQLGSNAQYIQYDSSNVDGIDSFLNQCGHIDSLILNAGVSLHEGSFLNVTVDGFDQQYNINLKANYFLAQAFLKRKLESEETGNLLFISSETAGNDIPYGLTKASINSLVGGLARRVYQKGIRVNAIAPGVTYTDMTKGDHEIADDFANNSAAGRYLLPEEIAEVACFMLSDASKCISGEILYCDAGSHLKINGFDNNYSL